MRFILWFALKNARARVFFSLTVLNLKINLSLIHKNQENSIIKVQAHLTA